MNILLLGEYSGLYSNLKDGIEANGHNAVIAAGIDGFKNLDVDIKLAYEGGGYSKLKTVLTVLSSLKKMKNFDIVQSVSPLFTNSVFFSSRLYNFLRDNNDSFYLSVAGDDSIVLDYWSNFGTNDFNLYLQDIQKYDGYQHNLLWGRSECKKWNESLARNVNGIIPIMYEYHKPYENYSNCIKCIPIPINLDKIQYKENKLISKKLIVFHGLNRYGAKGTKYIEEAFEILEKKYPNDLELIIDGKMPYEQYKKILSNANVIIDQTHSYSLAMNSLISMAMGKIVLGGNTPESSKEFGYDFNPSIGINSQVDSIIKGVESVLENRHRLEEIGEQSRLFVEKYHCYKRVSKMYLDIWSNR